MNIAARLDQMMLEDIVQLIDDGMCVCEMICDSDGVPVDYRFVAINDHFEEATGLADPVGKTAKELVPNLEQEWVDTYARVGLGREAIDFQSGSEAMGRWFDVRAKPIDPHGHFALLFRDITDLKTAESAREKALGEAERLLDELNHRVMNSLSMISSIIALEARAHGEGHAKAAFMRLRDRMNALASLYKTLNSGSSVESVCSHDYLGEILEGLRSSIAPDEKVTITGDVDRVRLSTRTAIPLGLIVNELVTNCLKYAFEPETGGSITVALKCEGPETLILKVSDDGRGAGESIAGNGLGRTLVEAFVTQLAGTIDNASTAGTSVAIRFPRGEPSLRSDAA